MGVDRRRLLRGGALAGGGAALGLATAFVPKLFPPKHLPFDGGYAAAADRPDYEKRGQVNVNWYVQTDEPVVAFTFDDGPGPRWTSMVLDTLDEFGVPATFFMVGQNVALHADVVKGRLARHDVGNHSWSHPDLATLDAPTVERQLTRTHEVVQKYLGREPHLLRPPYGHIGGSTLMAADRLNYDLVLWSTQMHEATYLHNPEGQVKEIVESTQPGQIVLAHDVGTSDRLVALRQLGAMFTGLRKRGFRFVTVSELLAIGRPGPTPAP